MHAQSRTNKSPFTVSVSQASVGSKSNHVALLYNKSLSVICVLFFFGFVVVGAVFVVGADLELKVDAVLFFFLTFPLFTHATTTNGMLRDGLSCYSCRPLCGV